MQLLFARLFFLRPIAFSHDEVFADNGYHSLPEAAAGLLVCAPPNGTAKEPERSKLPGSLNLVRLGGAVRY